MVEPESYPARLPSGPPQGPSAHQRPNCTSPEEHRDTEGQAGRNLNQGPLRKEHLVQVPPQVVPAEPQPQHPGEKPIMMRHGEEAALWTTFWTKAVSLPRDAGEKQSGIIQDFLKDV